MVETRLPENERARQSGKSPEAFRTIAEVSADIAVPQHVLRFWETKFPQIKPLKRGGGRRYYRPGDVEILRRIRDLLYGEGYTIRGAQKVLRQNGDRPGVETAPDASSCLGDDGALSPEARAELRAVLEDLEDLQRLLKRSPD